MASKLHQMILGLVVRKMQEKGYEIVAFDGKEAWPNRKNIRIPTKIKRHRPDAIGFNFNENSVCVGEAKTKQDLFSKRTREQLIDYSATKTKSTNKNVEIILGIPQSAEKDLLNLLISLNLYKKPFISYVLLPKQLVENEKKIKL